MIYDGLCIGGPLDGERRVEQEKDFQVVIPEKIPLVLDSPFTPEIKYSRCHYILDNLCFGSKRHQIWRPENQTAEKTFDMLFKGYRKP